MKRVFTVVLAAALALMLLAGCSRVPQEKLDAVQQRYDQLRELYSQAGGILAEIEAGGSQLPRELHEGFEKIGTGIGGYADMIDGDLRSMKESLVDELAGKMDADIAGLEELMPKLEEIRELYASGGVLDKAGQLQERVTQANGLMLALMGLANQAAGRQVEIPEEYRLRLEEISGQMAELSSRLEAEGAEMDEAAYEAVLAQLDGHIQSMEEMVAAIQPLVDAGGDESAASAVESAG